MDTAIGRPMIVATGFEPLRDLLLENAAVDPGHAAAVCVYLGGNCVLDIWTESTLAADAILPIFSSTKGMAGVAIAVLVERSQLDLDEPVARYWPEFAQAGKSGITVRTLLSHQAGLPGVRGGYDFSEVIDHHGLAGRLAAQRPFWAPGAAHGYHPITIGTLADELVRRIVGHPLGAFFATEIAGPLGADFFIGLPPAESQRVVDLEESRAAPGLPESPTGFRALSSARSSYSGPAAIVNDPRVRASGQAAISGVGSARALARVYAACFSDVAAGPGPADSAGRRLLSDDTIEDVSQLQTFGTDVVTGDLNGFATIFQKPGPSLPFGTFSAFGHAGVGGSLGYADPHAGLAFGYVVRRIPAPGAGDSPALVFSRLAQLCARKV